MSSALQQAMSREEFLLWVEAQEEPYEFDGEFPVLMTRANLGHNRIIIALLTAIADRLAGKPFEVLGPEAGLATTGARVRYPDTLITRRGGSDKDRLVPAGVAVFEVVSPSSARMDRIVKLREYGAVESIRTYVIVETETEAATQYDKLPDGRWSATALTVEDTITVAAAGIELPVALLYPAAEPAT